MRRFLNVLGFSAVALTVAAFRCPGPDPEMNPSPATTSGGGGMAGSSSNSTGGEGGDEGCVSRPDQDLDQDGWTVDEGDCDDCDPNRHPGLAELPTLGNNPDIDENCDGKFDDVISCEPQNVTGVLTATAAANAMELCDADANPGGWGLKDARLVRSDGANLPTNNGDFQQAAVLDRFGTGGLDPQVGGKLAVLSTGSAQAGNLPQACDQGGCGDFDTAKMPPDGLPKTMAGCPAPNEIFDDVALEVEIIPPPNAQGFVFFTAYLTREYPQSICSPYVDQFVAQKTPTPSAWGGPNMVFAESPMPPSVSFRPFPHCSPNLLMTWAQQCTLGAGCPLPPSVFCPQGAGLLAGTGFMDNGATTGWMETVVPLTSDQEFEIRFLIFDTENPLQDSTVLIDGFTWLGRTDGGALPVTYFGD